MTRSLEAHGRGAVATETRSPSSHGSGVLAIEPPTSRRARQGIPLRSAIDLCGYVDELDADLAGEIVVVDENESIDGAVFVEKGRVCWVAARGLSRRLSELLGARAQLAAAQMEEHYAACSRLRRPLGEYLVDRGVLSPESFHAALLQHTAESLNALFRKPVKGVWTPRTAGGYCPAFTFATGEVMTRALALDHPQASALAREHRADYLAQGEWTAAFARGGARAAPDPIAVFGAAPKLSQTLISVGKWAVSCLDVIEGAQAGDSLVWIRSRESSLVTFRRGPVIMAGETKEGGPARILNWQARRRREEGTSHGGL